ncbi:MAG: hypothetical protein GX862_07265 [Leucobacter sp.]|nr:hypothetical protein [Leucobacter sp.]
MADLSTHLLGRQFKNPVWVGASELTMDLGSPRISRASPYASMPVRVR